MIRFTDLSVDRTAELTSRILQPSLPDDTNRLLGVRTPPFDVMCASSYIDIDAGDSGTQDGGDAVGQHITRRLRERAFSAAERAAFDVHLSLGRWI